jgi:arabinogalactan endo-1,4-beta-galactosidase
MMKKTLLSLLAVMGVSLSAWCQETLLVGGDISVLPRYEEAKTSYYDNNGKKITDMLTYLKSEEVGWNALRVRLFVDPSGDSDPQVCQDLDYVVKLGKRIKAAGYTFMLDFHYSDTWADPSKQWTPESWLSLTQDELKQKIYDYTKECLQALVDADATPDYIQTGNEISYGMLWGAEGSNSYRCYTSSNANWPRFVALLSQASKACREVCPQAKIIIHTERAGNPSVLVGIYSRLAEVDYDVIGLSYYPFWHNGLSTLATSLNNLATNFPNKKVQIVETAYYYQWQPEKGQGIDYDFSSTWPVSKEGQAAFAQALIDELKKHPNVNGLYWWFPEENGNGSSAVKVLNGWVNRGLWNNSNHRAHPGLYVLKNFLGGETGITPLRGERRESRGERFDLQGRKLPEGVSSRSGLTIYNGKVMRE